MPTANKKLVDKLDSILNELHDEDYSSLPADDILKMRKDINPYGRTIEGSNKYLNFSITQIHHEYWKKLIITAFVGFLNRMNDEWKVPEGVPVVPVYEYLTDKSKADTPKIILEKNNESAIYDYDFNRKWMEKRIIVKEFLEEFLQFNPDEHVRSAYRPNRADTSRKPIETPAGKLAVDHLMKTDKEFRKKEQLYADVKQVKEETTAVPVRQKKLKKIVKGPDGKTKTVIRVVDVDADGNEIVKPKAVDKSKKIGDGADGTLSDTVREMIPPHDVFGRFKNYLQANYEELRDAVKDLFCEKPELELAINPYAIHDSLEDAEVFKKKHRNEVIAEVFTAHTGKWNFFDSFKEQRDSVNFYNDNTIILEEMVKQLEKDERLGKDLMDKRVTKTKKRNDIESGKDDPSFTKWRSQNKDLTALGATHIGDQADDECGDDEIEVPVWRVAKGGLELTRDKFYSKAEAPTFVKDAQDKAIASGDMQLKSGKLVPTPSEDRLDLDKAKPKPKLKPKIKAASETPAVPSRSDNLV